MDDAFCILTLLLVAFQTVECRNEESRLIDTIFQNYDNKSRPVHNESTIVQLQFRLALKQILDVDERNQILITNVWLTQYWNDEFLRWDKSEYGNLSSITVDSSLLWKPDLRLYNIGQEKYKGIDVESKTKAIVYSDGRVVWPSPHILKSVCKMDVTYFPFDDQYCQMIFAPWAYHGGQVNITNQSDGGDLSSYSPSGEFKVISLNVKRVVNEYACCPEPYPELIYTIHLRRKARFYLMNTIIPSTLISFLAFLSFGLPPDSGERISLVITTLLSLAVFMTITSEQIPQTSEVFPLLQKFLTAVMLQIGIALVANCVVISWASRGQPPSEFTRKLLSFEYFKTMLRCHHRKAKISADNPARRITENSDQAKEACKKKSNNENKMQNSGALQESHLEKEEINHWETGILKNLEIIANAKMLKKKKQINAEEWKLAAATLDRICGVIFASTMMFTLAYIFLAAPRVNL